MKQPDVVREKAWVLAVGPGDDGELDVQGLSELNEALAKGYRVVRFERMSEGGDGTRGLAFVVASKRFPPKRK